jgi:UDP-N-acetylmuramate dehydrogenase
MKEAQKMALAGIALGGLFFDRSLARYTTIGIGGPAECLYEPADLQSLASVLAFLNRESISYLVMGKGSNILVTDKGFHGWRWLSGGVFQTWHWKKNRTDRS